MSSTFIIFRGEEVEIEYEDRGYEPDVNYWNLDWWFVDERFDDAHLTEMEEQAILDHIWHVSQDEKWSD